MSSQERLQERAVCRQGFEIYYGLGVKRTYQAVADQLGVSKSTVKNWSKRFRWRDQIEQRTAAEGTSSGSGMIDRDAPPLPRGVAQYLKLVEAAETLCLRQLSEGNIRPTVHELARLIEARLACDGIADAEPGQYGEPIVVMIEYPQNT